MMAARTRKKNLFQNQWVIGAIIFIVALLVRYIGLKFGFPLLVHPDEGFIINNVRGMSVTKTLDPGTYLYPGFVSFYTKLFVLELLSWLKFGANYGLVYWKDLYTYYVVARLLTAIQGALIPVVAWMIGRKFKNLNFSWFAAILVHLLSTLCFTFSLRDSRHPTDIIHHAGTALLPQLFEYREKNMADIGMPDGCSVSS